MFMTNNTEKTDKKDKLFKCSQIKYKTRYSEIPGNMEKKKEKEDIIP